MLPLSLLLFIVIMTVSWVGNEVKARDERVRGEKLTIGEARNERSKTKESVLMWARGNN